MTPAQPQRCLSLYSHMDVPRGPESPPATQVPSAQKLLDKIQWSFCSLSCWEQSCCWSGCSGTGPTPPKSPAPKTDAQAESSKDAQGYQSSIISISCDNHCCSFQLSIAIFCLQCFFFFLSRVYFYFFYIEFHLALH